MTSGDFNKHSMEWDIVSVHMNFLTDMSTLQKRIWDRHGLLSKNNFKTYIICKKKKLNFKADMSTLQKKFWYQEDYFIFYMFSIFLSSIVGFFYLTLSLVHECNISLLHIDIIRDIDLMMIINTYLFLIFVCYSEIV